MFNIFLKIYYCFAELKCSLQTNSVAAVWCSTAPIAPIAPIAPTPADSLNDHNVNAVPVPTSRSTSTTGEEEEIRPQSPPPPIGAVVVAGDQNPSLEDPEVLNTIRGAEEVVPPTVMPGPSVLLATEAEIESIEDDEREKEAAHALNINTMAISATAPRITNRDVVAGFARGRGRHSGTGTSAADNPADPAGESSSSAQQARSTNITRGQRPFTYEEQKARRARRRFIVARRPLNLRRRNQSLSLSKEYKLRHFVVKLLTSEDGSFVVNEDGSFVLDERAPMRGGSVRIVTRAMYHIQIIFPGKKIIIISEQ